MSSESDDSLWHPFCILARKDQYEDFERRSLAVLAKFRMKPSTSRRTVYISNKNAAEHLSKLRGFLQFILEYESYDYCLPLFYPNTPEGSWSIGAATAIHYMYCMCFLKESVVHLAGNEIQVIQNGRNIPLLGRGEWHLEQSKHLDSFTTALSILHTAQGITEPFVEACPLCETNWTDNGKQGCDLHFPWFLCRLRHKGNVTTSIWFKSAKKYLKQYYEEIVLPQLQSTSNKENIVIETPHKVHGSPTQNSGASAAIEESSICPKITQAAYLVKAPNEGDDSVLNDPLAAGNLVTPNHAARVDQNPVNLAATVSNSFICHHIQTIQNGVSDRETAHSSIMLHSLNGLVQYKCNEAVQRKKWEEDMRLQFLLQRLAGAGVDPTLLQQHASVIYGPNNLIDTCFSSEKEEEEAAYPPLKKAKLSESNDSNETSGQQVESF